MKRNLFPFVLILILVMTFSAFTLFTGSMNKVNPEIELVNRSGGTRSGTVTEVKAFILDDHTLTVEVENYNGLVCVDVTGAGDARQQVVEVSESAVIVMDLSMLPQGVYLLSVTLENGLYEGYFEY